MTDETSANERAAIGRQMLIRAAALVLLTIIAYLPIIYLRAGFIWDDDSYVINNMNLRSLAGLRDIWFKIGATPQYYPLVHTTFWIEYHLWGLNPLGYHIVNILLHAAGALALWMVLRRLRIPGVGCWLAESRREFV